jgi:hypothetical protein
MAELRLLSQSMAIASFLYEWYRYRGSKEVTPLLNLAARASALTIWHQYNIMDRRGSPVQKETLLSLDGL